MGSGAVGSSGIGTGVQSSCLLARIRAELSLLPWLERNLQEPVQVVLGGVCVAVPEQNPRTDVNNSSRFQARGFSPPSPLPQVPR